MSKLICVGNSSFTGKMPRQTTLQKLIKLFGVDNIVEYCDGRVGVIKSIWWYRPLGDDK